MYNTNFNSVEFDGLKNVGLHTFTFSVTEWCEKTNTIAKYQLDVLNIAENIKLLGEKNEQK